jgi:hypothetical protein
VNFFNFMGAEPVSINPRPDFVFYNVQGSRTKSSTIFGRQLLFNIQYLLPDQPLQAISASQRRLLSIHEYQSVKLLNSVRSLTLDVDLKD